MFCIGIFFITDNCEGGEYIICAGSSHIQGNVPVEPAKYCYLTLDMPGYTSWFARCTELSSILETIKVLGSEV